MVAFDSLHRLYQEPVRNFESKKEIRMQGDWGNHEIRHGDLPRHKEAVMSQLFGEMIGWLQTQGITKGEEFETHNQGILQCSRKYIWVDQFHPDKGMTFSFGSIGMDLTLGVYKKPNKEILVKEELKNLRYKISTGTSVELIDSHRSKVNSFFDIFKREFLALKAEMLTPANAGA